MELRCRATDIALLLGAVPCPQPRSRALLPLTHVLIEGHWYVLMLDSIEELKALFQRARGGYVLKASNPKAARR